MRTYTFLYGYAANQTVTVKAESPSHADLKAREVMDKRYAKLGREPPVAWTLGLIKIGPLLLHK